MKKVLLLIIAVSLIVSAFSLCAFAGEEFVFDEASILTEREIAALNADAEKFYSDYGVRALILTSNTVGENEVEGYADDFVYNNYGYGAEAIILFISFRDRDVVVASYGESGYVFSKRVCDSIRNSVTNELSYGNYESAFAHFINLCAEREDEYRAEGDDDYDHEDDPYIDRGLGREGLGIGIVVSVGVSLIIAFSVAGGMKKKLKTANPAHLAEEYIVPNSFELTNKNDMFLYSNTTRVARPTDNSSGSRGGFSGGGGHSVSHGKF